MQGTIQRLIRGKGFGFILVEGRQYFFHHSEVQGIAFKKLNPGDIVEFQPQEEPQGRNPRATEITIVEKKERLPRSAARRPQPRGKPGVPRAQGASRFDQGQGSRGPSGSSSREAESEMDAADREFITEIHNP
jgi:cold shock CspA family protein